jgi:hypothetical protein
MRTRTTAPAAALLAAALLGTAAAAGAAPKTDKDPLADFQADLSAGAVSASELLGVAPSAVSTLQTPKDFIAALDAMDANGGKAGFGLAFTPSRTRFAPVSIARYRQNLGARVWAGTTLSYAQNTTTLAGTDYRQQAYALRLAWYWNAEDDPFVAGYTAFEKCDPLKKLEQDRGRIFVELMAKLQAQGVPAAELDERARAQLPAEMADNEFRLRASRLYRECVDAGIKGAREKWNATQLALMLGEGRIRDAAGAPGSLSLGRHAAFTAALGPNADSLVNLTLRHTQKALDTSTLASTPAYRSNTLVGARWTYRAAELEDLYGLAEISNAKSNRPSTASIFKFALGVDKRLSEGLWIQLRVGRNHTADGRTEQTTALMSLKFSPQSTLLAR